MSSLLAQQDDIIRRAKSISDELEKTLDELLILNQKAGKKFAKEIKRNHFVILSTLGRKKETTKK